MHWILANLLCVIKTKFPTTQTWNTEVKSGHFLSHWQLANHTLKDPDSRYAQHSHKTVCNTSTYDSMFFWPCIMNWLYITNLIRWLLFIHKILFSPTCFEPQMLIFRRIQFYTCSMWYCHSLREFVVACRYTAWVRTDCRGKFVGRA